MSVRELSPELAQKAKDELFEDPTKIPENLQIIKNWLVEQPHINARMDDQWLIAFLRGCKHNLESTKEKLDLFYTMRTIAPEVTIPLDPMSECVQYVLKSGAMLPLKKTINPADPPIMIMRPGLIDFDKISIMDFLLIMYMYTYIQIVEDDKSVVAGQAMICDMTGMGIGFFSQVTPIMLKKLMVTRQEAYPIRQKGGHHINSPAVFEKIFKFLSLFINDKMKSRVYVHADMEALYKLVPKSILPAEYGGDGGPAQDIIDEWKTKFESYRDWFLKDAEYKTDESKRPGGPKTVETLFGFDHEAFIKPEFD